jgi:hypothetical protein
VVYAIFSRGKRLDGMKAAGSTWLAVSQVVIELINAKIEIFKSMAYPYRGH